MDTAQSFVVQSGDYHPYSPLLSPDLAWSSSYAGDNLVRFQVIARGGHLPVHFYRNQAGGFFHLVRTSEADPGIVELKNGTPQSVCDALQETVSQLRRRFVDAADVDRIEVIERGAPATLVRFAPAQVLTQH